MSLIIQSPGDLRKYRHITLTNGLECTLVSDSTTDKASAAMQVNVGHMSDDPRTPGLAHFLEHMLFQGTTTYPGAASYKKFLSDHGGSSNASTGMVTTTYFFDITHPFLELAVDRFSKFFIEPLFSQDCTDRELNAVNSENAKNILNDRRRLFQLSKHLCDPTHSYHKFGTGNRATLETTPKLNNVDVRELLLQFHAKYYSANIMKCCILGKESLDALEALAISKFTAVPNHNVTIPVFNGSPFRSIDVKQRFDVVPIKEVRWIRLDFVLPTQKQNFMQKPYSYISHLIGHEGSGSILAVLKQLNYANGLSCGLNTNLNEFGIFRISIDCTEQGILHINQMIEIVFTYITMLQSNQPKEWIYNEKKQMASNAFRFKSKSSARNSTKSIVSNMNQGWKTENILIGNYFCSCEDNFNATLIVELLQELNINNLRIFVAHRSFQNRQDGVVNEKETWYGCEYSNVKVTDEIWSKWKTPTLEKDHLLKILSMKQVELLNGILSWNHLLLHQS